MIRRARRSSRSTPILSLTSARTQARYAVRDFHPPPPGPLHGHPLTGSVVVVVDELAVVEVVVAVVLVVVDVLLVDDVVVVGARLVDVVELEAGGVDVVVVVGARVVVVVDEVVLVVAVVVVVELVTVP